MLKHGHSCSPSALPSPITQDMANPGSLSREEMATLFSIPTHFLRDLTKPERDGNLRSSYQKYLTILTAYATSQKQVPMLIKEGTWTGKGPSEQELADLVVSKTMWYSHYKKLFSKVPQYPDMHSWLKNEEGAPADHDIWGEEKGVYQFKDLSEWLDQKGRRGKSKQVKGKKGKKKDVNDVQEQEEKEKKSKKKKKN